MLLPSFELNHILYFLISRKFTSVMESHNVKTSSLYKVLTATIPEQPKEATLELHSGIKALIRGQSLETPIRALAKPKSLFGISHPDPLIDALSEATKDKLSRLDKSAEESINICQETMSQGSSSKWKQIRKVSILIPP